MKLLGIPFTNALDIDVLTAVNDKIIGDRTVQAQHQEISVLILSAISLACCMVVLQDLCMVHFHPTFPRRVAFPCASRR
jgi:hypothetical protein